MPAVPSRFHWVSTLRTYTITEGRVCDGLWMSKTVRKKNKKSAAHADTSDVNRVDWSNIPADCTVCIPAMFPDSLCLLWRNTAQDHFGNFNSGWRSAVFVSTLQIKDVGQTKKKKGEKQLLYEWTPQKRKDWQSQTSLFLPLLQVTYCKIDYSNNFPLLCCR